MSLLAIFSGTLIGLGIFVAVLQVLPGRPHLDAALARIHGTSRPQADPLTLESLGRRIGSLPWLPVPSTDLALLGEDREKWLTSKVTYGLVGLFAIPFFEALLFLVGHPESLTVPAIASVVLGVGL